MGEHRTFNAFKGTNIKTPFERMRAKAIICANMDTRGLSLISFNLTTFLKKGREDDAFYILSHWAIEPTKQHTLKFHQNPQTGQQALIGRAEKLIEYLEKREDTSDYFLETVLQYMTQHIKDEITLIIQEQYQSSG